MPWLGLAILLTITLPMICASSALALVTEPEVQARGSKTEADSKDDSDIGSRSTVLTTVCVALALVAFMTTTLWLMTHTGFFRWLFTGNGPAIAFGSLMVLLPGMALRHIIPTLRGRRLFILLLGLVVLVVLWAIFRTWFLADLMAAAVLAFAAMGMRLRSSFVRLSFILLLAALLYDVWQSFGTGNMGAIVDLAVPQSGQVKPPMLVPIPGQLSWSPSTMRIIGVGDLLITSLLAVAAGRLSRRIGSWTPFVLVIAGYSVAMIVCLFCGWYFNSGQPATIYIVPLCGGLVLAYAKATGNWSEVQRRATHLPYEPLVSIERRSAD